MINWQTYVPNPSKPPKPSSGYAFEYEGGDYESFHEVGDEEWDIVVIGRETDAEFKGRRKIDDVLVAVWETPAESEGHARWIAQQVFG
jgi:hypothetical protein